MSYILDALKKADQERSIGQVPDLDASHWGARRQTRRNYRIWIILALVLLNVVLILVMMTGHDVDTPSQSADVEHMSQPPVAEPVPGELIVGEVPAVAPPLRMRDPKPVVVPAPAPTPAQPPAASIPAPVTPGATTSPAVTTSSGLPEWAELPLEFRSRFPLPHIDVHVHDEDAERRFIMINLKKYREGQTLDSGARLDRINPDSIELSFEGTRFRIDR